MEKFEELYPIILEGRVHPQAFAETITKCTQIMRDHMSHIETRPLKMLLLLFFIIFFATLLLTGIPLLIYFLVYVNSRNAGDGFWVC